MSVRSVMPSPVRRTDRPSLWDLVELAQAGDSDAFGELYKRTRYEIFCFLQSRVRDHQLAEDLTAETYIRAFKAIGRVRRMGTSPVGWLVIIARNESVNWQRSRDCRPAEAPFGVGIENRLSAGDAAADPVHDALDVQELLRAVSEVLTAEQRDVMVARFLLDLPLKEASERVGKPGSAVASLTFRAVRALRSDPRIAELHTAHLGASA